MNKNIKIIEDSDLLINARNPQGKLGNKLIDKMNVNHEGLAKWSLSHLDISKDNVILDIGCGGGVNVSRFLKTPKSSPAFTCVVASHFKSGLAILLGCNPTVFCPEPVEYSTLP